MKKLLKKRYEIVGVLGRGGMGCVYKVADRVGKGRVLAVKELHRRKLSPDKLREAVAQFQTEARILMRFSHPNLPKVYDFFTDSGAYYIVMEYIRGNTLEHILDGRRGKPVDERLTLAWALQICRAMHFLSVQRPRPIVFRDLKPSNIMITRDGVVKLIDFGIARFFKLHQAEDTYVYGTPGYAAPEQYGTGQTDTRSDIFSLGATLHHCLTGRNPSESPLDFPDVRSLNPKVSRETAAIVARALEPEREKRFPTALAMKQAVQKVLLSSIDRVKGGGKVVAARPGKVIKLPWWNRISWVSVPVTALGCSGTTGTLSTDDLWIQPRPKEFSPESARLLFRVDGSRLSPGKEYRPHITVRTDAGRLQPRLVFRKSWPWLVIEAVAALAVIVIALLMR